MMKMTRRWWQLKIWLLLVLYYYYTCYYYNTAINNETVQWNCMYAIMILYIKSSYVMNCRKKYWHAGSSLVERPRKSQTCDSRMWTVQRYEEGDPFLHRIIAIDETWVRDYKPEQVPKSCMEGKRGVPTHEILKSTVKSGTDVDFLLMTTAEWSQRTVTSRWSCYRRVLHQLYPL